MGLEADDTIACNYMHVKEMTHEEKIEMYMKMKKMDIIKMLLENQRLVDVFRETANKYELR